MCYGENRLFCCHVEMHINFLFCLYYSENMSEISSTALSQLDDPSRSVQVQVLPPQDRGTNIGGTLVHTVTPTFQPSLSNPSSLLSSVTGQTISPEVSAQITQLTGLRLPADQQQKLLLAAQLQQLTKCSSGSLPANTSFLIQSAFPTGSIAVVSSSSDTAPTKV